MPIVDMNDLGRSVRGAQRYAAGGSGSGPPFHILGMVSGVRSAVKRVHSDSPTAGQAQIRGSLRRWLAYASSTNRGEKATYTAANNYIATVDVCAGWHGSSSLTYLGWEERGVVQYATGDAVEVMVRLVLEDATGQVWGRLIYWDGPALDATAAELLASPVVEVLDAHYGSGRVAGVEVWQCRTLQQHVVSASVARAARNNVAAHVAGM